MINGENKQKAIEQPNNWSQSWRKKALLGPPVPGHGPAASPDHHITCEPTEGEKLTEIKTGTINNATCAPCTTSTICCPIWSQRSHLRSWLTPTGGHLEQEPAHILDLRSHGRREMDHGSCSFYLDTLSHNPLLPLHWVDYSHSADQSEEGTSAEPQKPSHKQLTLF